MIRERTMQLHVCPLGMYCASVPIYYGRMLAGIAKCVAGRETGKQQFSRAIRQLELIVEKYAQDFRVSVLVHQLAAAREQVESLKQIRTAAVGPEEDRGTSEPCPVRPRHAQGKPLVERALDHIGGHFLEPGLSLRNIGDALGVNDTYLAHLFASSVGQGVRAYVLQLRVQYSCRLLLQSERAIKAIAYESGFRRADVFRRAFRRSMGVGPAEYRRAFARA